MGGLGRLMPHTRTVFLIGCARARRHPAVRRLLLEGLDHRRDARRAAPSAYVLVARRARRRVPDRPLHLPAVLHRLHRRAVRVRRRALPRRTSGKEGPLSMVWTVTVLAVLSVGRRLPPVRARRGSRSPTGSTRSPRRSLEATDTAGARRVGRRRRLRARRDRRRLGALRLEDARRCPRAARRCSSTSSTSTRSTTSSSTSPPSRSRARFQRFVERPLIAGSIGEVDRRLRPRLA